MYSLVLFLLASPSTFAALCNSAPWSDPERISMVQVHNALRSSIAKGSYYARGVHKPPASNMMKMVYDCSLEASAQTFANRCPADHSRITGLGENMFFRHSNTPLTITNNGRRAAQNWAYQFHQKGWPSNLLTVDMANLGIGEAIQMAWHKTNRVGCGVSLCNAGKTVTVVCHYRPQGNYLNSMIYNTGRTCSACPAGSICEASSGLCVGLYY